MKFFLQLVSDRRLAISSSKRRTFAKFAEVAKALQIEGFEEKRQKGGHVQFVKGNGRVTVPRHCGDIPVGTLHSIIKQTKENVVDINRFMKNIGKGR